MVTHNLQFYSFDIEKLKMERARQGKSMRQIAELTMLDIKTIVRIENYKVNSRIQTIGKIANALGKDVEDFINKNTVDADAVRVLKGGEDHDR